jgi:hypothetical protein
LACSPVAVLAVAISQGHTIARDCEPVFTPGLLLDKRLPVLKFGLPNYWVSNKDFNFVVKLFIRNIYRYITHTHIYILYI